MSVMPENKLKKSVFVNINLFPVGLLMIIMNLEKILSNIFTNDFLKMGHS